jgi:hypothetical protein
MPFVAHVKTNVLVTACVDGEDREFEWLNSVCSGIKVIAIVAPYPKFSGAVYSLFRSMLLVDAVTASKGVDPAVPIVPAWGHVLYEGRERTDD